MSTLVRYAAVDDVGRAINPLILHGQTHGGIAQGVGQALWEHSHYDADSGQLLAASFMDYAMPRADTLPSFDTALSEVPSPTNPLGIRAGGEGGTTPALGAVDQCRGRCARRIRRHAHGHACTPEKMWRAIRVRRAGKRDSAQPAEVAHIAGGLRGKAASALRLWNAAGLSFKSSPCRC